MLSKIVFVVAILSITPSHPAEPAQIPSDSLCPSLAALTVPDVILLKCFFFFLKRALSSSLFSEKGQYVVAVPLKSSKADTLPPLSHGPRASDRGSPGPFSSHTAPGPPSSQENCTSWGREAADGCP